MTINGGGVGREVGEGSGMEEWEAGVFSLISWCICFLCIIVSLRRTGKHLGNFRKESDHVEFA